MLGITPQEAHTTQPYRSRGLALFVIICFQLSLTGGLIAYSQQAAPDPMPTTSPEATVQSLKDSLFDLNQEIQLLQHFLEASTVDARSLMGTNLRSWHINNPALRDSLFAVFIQVDSSVQAEAGAEAAVLATLGGDLVEVRFGNAVFKGMTLKEAIDRSGDKNLYRKVVASYAYSRDIEMRDPDARIPSPYHPQIMESALLPETFSPRPLDTGKSLHGIAGEISLEGLSVQTGNHWGGEIRLGFEEANLPFWTSGTFQLLGTYDRVKFGAALPLRGGRYGFPLFAPFTIRPRLLNGAPGVVASADFGLVGGSLAFLRMTSDHLNGLTDPRNFYYLSGYAILYSSFGVAIDRNTSTRAKFGGGLRRVTKGRVIPALGDVQEGYREMGQETLFSPYLSLEYTRQGSDEVIRAGVQFFDLTVSFFGSLDIIPSVLSIEARYLWPIAPVPRAWENPDFLFVTPKLHLTF